MLYGQKFCQAQYADYAWMPGPKGVSGAGVQSSPPTLDLMDTFPEFPSKDFTEENAFRLLRGVRLHPLPGFTQWVFKREFGLKSLIQYLWCVTTVNV